VKAWCVSALPGLPIASAEYKAASALLDGVHAAEERLGLRETRVGELEVQQLLILCVPCEQQIDLVCCSCDHWRSCSNVVADLATRRATVE
jgi:hypothetical protein